MFDEENNQASKDIRMHQEQYSTNLPQESGMAAMESKQNFDEYEIQELLQDERLLEYVMEDKERPEKRRKLESDKGDGVLPVPSRSPRVVLNKIKLKQDVLERLRKIKKFAQAHVKENSLSSVKVPEKEIKESKAEQLLQDKGTDFENNTLRDGTWNEQNQKQKRKREEDKDGDQEKQELSVTKVAKINSEPVPKETPTISESVASEEQNVVKRGEEDSAKEKEQLALSAEGYTVSNSEEHSVSIATPSKGDEVAKAAQNYAKSGAQTEPKQDNLLNDEKIVVVVTEVLEEGNYRTQENSLISEQETHVDNNNLGEQEETPSDDGREEDEDYMSNAIYQLIKDVVKNRTEYFESALLRENEKLEERVSQLEKQNALLHKVSYRLDYALKEITKKRQEASQSRISRGTQVNMNLHLSRTSTSKSTPIEIDVPEEAENKTSSPQPKSNPTVLGGNNTSSSPPRKLRSPTHPETIGSKTTKETAAPPTSSSLGGNNTSRPPPRKLRTPTHPETIDSKTTKETAAPPTSSSLEGNHNSRSTPSKLRSPTHPETIGSKTTNEKSISPTSSSSTHSKLENNRPTRTQPGENKSSARSERISAPQSKESARMVSTGTQHEQQDSSTNKKLQQGMGHFRLSPSYKRAAQQQNITEDIIETGHFRITPTGLEPQSICSSQRVGNSSVNEPSRAQVTTRPSSSPRAQKMDTSMPRSSPSQSNSNSSPLAGSSSSSTRGQSRSSSFSQAATQEERSIAATVSSVATKNAAGNALEKRSQSSSTLTVPTARSSPLSKAMTQEKRNLSTPPSLINTKIMRVENLERKSQTSGTSTVVTTSRAPPLSSGQHRTSTKEPSRTLSTERINTSQQRKESANNEEPEIVIVSPTTISSPKEQSKKVVRNERVGSQGEISGSQMQNRKGEQARVRIHQVENQSLPSEKPPPSNKQRTEDMRTPKQRVQQHPQGTNHQPSSNQQIAYRSHDIVRVSTAPRDNVPPLRSNEPQQHVRYIMREDGTCLQVVQEQPRQVDKGQPDPQQHPRYVVHDARGQHPTDKAPTAVRYDPKQPPRYAIQEGPQHRIHEGPRQPLQGVPQQQALPPGAIAVHQQYQGSAVSGAGNKAVGPRPPPIGIQDVRTQPPQPYAMQQQQQHIIVKQHPPVQNPQHPHQYQQAAYQYQQPQHRPTVPQQQNVPRTQAAVYYPPQTMQQVPPPTNNQPTGYQPRPTVLPQEYVTSSRIPPERATVRSNIQVGGHVNARQPPNDVVYQPGMLEGSTVRPSAPMPPQAYQPRPAFVHQGRQPQINNQGIPRPMMEHSMPRPSVPGGARYAQTLEQQRVQERRTQGQTPPEKTQPSTAVGQRDSVHRQPSPPKPTASIAIVENGIVLSWNITTGETTENIECYELFACQDDSNSTLPPIMWKKIGVVKALPLPMACTLTQFSSGSRYQFAVRAVDTSERAGPFSDPCVITLKR